jgi:predicted alpha/beta-fold hydrolase
MDLRACGAGKGLAKRPYHAGRSPDAAAAIRFLAELCPLSPVALIGFSLGGNIALKLAGESGDRPPGNLDRVMAVCPPVDLSRCVRSLTAPLQRQYTRHFASMLWNDIQQWWESVPDAPRVQVASRPRTVLEIDEAVTAPLGGFASAEDYYAKCSSGPLLANVKLPTLLLGAHDDPLVPAGPILDAKRSPAVHMVMTASGGHMGYFGRAGADPDIRWLDWRVVDFVLRATEAVANETLPAHG